MPGGRPRTPTLKLEQRGAFDKHPERKRARSKEPKVADPLGDPPPELNVLEVTIWQEIQATGFWLTIADRLQVEIAVRALGRFRAGDLKAGNLAQGALAKLGFNPTDRSRIHHENPNERNSDPAEKHFA